MDDDDSFPPPPPPYNEADLYEPYEPGPDLDVAIDLPHIPNANVDLESINVNQEPANRVFESSGNDQQPIDQHSEFDHSSHCHESENRQNSSLDVSSDSEATIESNEESSLPNLEEFSGSSIAFNKNTEYEVSPETYDRHEEVPNVTDNTAIRVNNLSAHPISETNDNRDTESDRYSTMCNQGCINVTMDETKNCDATFVRMEGPEHPLFDKSFDDRDTESDRKSDRYSTSMCNEGCIHATMDNTKDCDVTFVRMEGPEHPLLDKSFDSDAKLSGQQGYCLIPSSDKSIDPEAMTNDKMQEERLKTDQCTDEDTKSYSSDYVLLSRIGTGPPVPGTQYTYKNCSLVYKDSMNDVKYVWKEGKVQVKPVDSKKSARKSPAGIKLCVGVTILLTIAVVFLLLSLV